MEDDEEVALAEGMPAASPDGEPLGKLSALLIEEEEEDAEFLLLQAGDADRLIPFEAVLGVDEGTLILNVPAANVARFPKLRPDAEPTAEEMQLAYDVFDEGAADPDEDA
jgi:hypothetical protein